MKFVLAELGRSTAGIGVRKAELVVKQQYPAGSKLIEGFADLMVDAIGQIGRGR
jgi:hypothetical protein